VGAGEGERVGRWRWGGGVGGDHGGENRMDGRKGGVDEEYEKSTCALEILASKM